MAKTYSFSELSRSLGKEPFYIKNIQKAFSLYVPKTKRGYKNEYLRFLEKIVLLRAFNVPQDKIVELFDTEKKILTLLHIDSLTTSATWYLDACASNDDVTDGTNLEYRLLLSGHNLGFPVSGSAVQHHLDFGQSDPELFKGVEMGEDVRQVIEKYTTLLAAVKTRITRERRILEDALDWARRHQLLNGRK